MSEQPQGGVVVRAAEVIERAFLDTRQGKMRYDWVTGAEVAEALAAAGLLAGGSPATDEQRAATDIAEWALLIHRRTPGTTEHNEAWARFHQAVDAERVRRAAATSGAE